MIPFLIDMMVLIEDFHSKSERQVAILNRNFFFMMLNSFLLPMTELTTIKTFAANLESVDAFQWPEYLAKNLL